MPITDRAQNAVPIMGMFPYGRLINIRKEGGQISGRSIEAHPPGFDFASFLDSEALSKAISHSLGCK